MNPWKIIGWVLLGLLLLFLAFCSLVAVQVARVADAPGTASAPRNTSNPQLRARIVEFKCTASRGGMAIIEGTILNAGSTRLSYVKVSGEFRGEGNRLVGHGDGYGEATHLEPGQSTHFRVLGPSEAYKTCGITQVLSGFEIVRMD